MNGKFHTQVRVELERGKENSSLQFDHQHANFSTAPSSCAYHAFALTFKALEAPYFCRETVLQFPGCRYTENKSALVPEKVFAEENIFARMCQLMRK
jgi:hypothetical protein